jgi:Tfp pilus assembly protein PilN
MIKINLMGMERPKKGRGPSMGGPAGSSFILVLGAVIIVVSLGALAFLSYQLKRDRDDLVAKVEKLKQEKTRLTGLKQQVDAFQEKKKIIDQRIQTIKDLERNKTGGQELLDMLATTVARTDAMWLTSVERKGNSLIIDGTAASLAALANYITQLKRSGYFEKVEIKETKQDDENLSVQTFWFTLLADKVQPKTAPESAAPAPAAAPKKS